VHDDDPIASIHDDVHVMLDEEHQRLLSLLRDERLRQVAISRIEGRTVAEIARDLGLCARSIERKLRLIRNTWASEFTHAG